MIYFIRVEPAGPVKVVYTATPKGATARLRQLEESMPHRLRLVGLIEGNRPREKAIHHAFFSFRMRGEWFEPHESLLAAIERMMDAAFDWSKQIPRLLKDRSGGELQELYSVSEIVSALGGATAVARLIGGTTQQVHNWRSKPATPAVFYLLLGVELLRAGFTVKQSLLGQRGLGVNERLLSEKDLRRFLGATEA